MTAGTYERRWEGEGRKRKRAAADAPATATDAAKESYYGVPVIHGSHWKWLVICYFFLGGISAASHVLATVAHFVGGPANKPIVRTGRYISFAALIPCPLLLILDLGRPERFVNMLRIVKLRSPMSLGSWALTLFGPFAAIAALVQAAEDGLFGRNRVTNALANAPAGAASAAGAGPALFVGGYTGVLLGATAVPLWGKNAYLLGPLFLNSAFASAIAAINAGIALQPDAPAAASERLEALDRVVIASELALLAASRANLGDLARPVTTGQTGAALGYGTVGLGLIAPLALQAVNRRRRSRAVSLLASILSLSGGFLLRYAWIVGGKESADDPQATFAYTRRRS